MAIKYLSLSRTNKFVIRHHPTPLSKEESKQISTQTKQFLYNQRRKQQSDMFHCQRRNTFVVPLSLYTKDESKQVSKVSNCICADLCVTKEERKQASK